MKFGQEATVIRLVGGIQAMEMQVVMRDGHDGADNDDDNGDDDHDDEETTVIIYIYTIYLTII